MVKIDSCILVTKGKNSVTVKMLEVPVSLHFMGRVSQYKVLFTDYFNPLMKPFLLDWLLQDENVPIFRVGSSINLSCSYVHNTGLTIRSIEIKQTTFCFYSTNHYYCRRITA